MNTVIKTIFIFIALFLGLGAFAQTDSSVISAIQKEVDRNKAELKMEGIVLPFFISYSVLDRYDYSLSASLGSINSYNEAERL